jgi:hypothetical protein
VDALPPSELRERVRTAIESHIDRDRWQKLQRVEELEQQTLVDLVGGWRKADLGTVPAERQEGGSE